MPRLRPVAGSRLSAAARRVVAAVLSVAVLVPAIPAVAPAASTALADEPLVDSCPSLTWTGYISYALGDNAIAPVQAKAEAEARQLLGLAPGADVLDQARGLVRAYMFAELTRIIGEVHDSPGSVPAADQNAYDTFAWEVQREREWIASEANTLYNESQNDPQNVWATVAAGVFGFLGVPGVKAPPQPTSEQFLDEAAGRAYDGGWATLSGSTAVQAQEGAVEGLKLLAAIGRGPTQPGDAPSGEATFGREFWQETVAGLSESFEFNLSFIVKAALGAIGNEELPAYGIGAALALVNAAFTISSAVDTVNQLNDNAARSEQAPDLFGAMGSAAGQRELFSVFMAMTMKNPNDPVDPGNADCQARGNVFARPQPVPAATPTDPVFWVAGASSSQSVLGGSGPSDPSVMDWSYSRLTGPVAARQRATHYVQHIYIENTGAPTAGTWTLTVNSVPAPPSICPAIVDPATASDQCKPYAPRTTAPLSYNATESDIAAAIQGMFKDYPDIQVAVQREGSGAPKGYPPSSGDQTPSFVGTAPPTEWFLEFYGDTGTWQPHVLSVHTDTAANGGICVNVFLGVCSLDKPEDILRLETLWGPTQASDGADNTGPTTLWPDVYPAGGECQSVGFSNGVFVDRFVYADNSCGTAAVDNSWGQSASLRYVDPQGNLWTAWKVAGNQLLNVEDAALAGGTAKVYAQRSPNGGLDAVPGACETSPTVDYAPADLAGLCVVGSGTSFTSDFQAGDQIMLQGSGNGPSGGITSVIRTISSVVDDTHLQLGSSAACPIVSDGTNCLVGLEGPFMPYSHEYTDPQFSSPTATPSFFDSAFNQGPFTIYRLAHNTEPAGGCPTWNALLDAAPPASPCYYSSTLQFRDQHGATVEATLGAPGSAAPTLASVQAVAGSYDASGQANTTLQLVNPLGPGSAFDVTLGTTTSGSVSVSTVTPPADVPVPSGTTVISAFTVNLSGGITDAAISGVTIRFTTASSVSNAAVERFSNGAWTLLPARLLSTSGGTSTWEVTSPGFSTYAIVGNRTLVGTVVKAAARVGRGTKGVFGSSRTLVVRNGSYVTLRFAVGRALAGATLEIQVATRTGGRWSAYRSFSPARVLPTGFAYLVVRIRGWEGFRALYPGSTTRGPGSSAPLIVHGT